MTQGESTRAHPWSNPGRLHRSLAAGEPDAAAEVVLVVPTTKWVAEAIGVGLRTSRNSWWSPLGSGWPELAPATTLAATGVRPKANLTLEGSVRCGSSWLGAT